MSQQRTVCDRTRCWSAKHLRVEVSLVVIIQVFPDLVLVKLAATIYVVMAEMILAQLVLAASRLAINQTSTVIGSVTYRLRSIITSQLKFRTVIGS